jgi:transposase InsO family protein
LRIDPLIYVQIKAHIFHATTPKNFKRDYVWINYLLDDVMVIGKLGKWFNGYNEVAPHKGLKMLSPRQFLRKVG